MVMQITLKKQQPLLLRLFNLMVIMAIASIVIINWVWFAGPNIDTILTYHRNHLAHHWMEMFQILAGQDQAPLPQLFHYTLHILGFSGVVALQVSSSLIVVLILLYILAADLKNDQRDQKLSHPLWIYTFAAIAMLISPSFSAALTWVRYSIIVGVLWYGVWVLEESISKFQYSHASVFGLGLILGFGFLISYTWGVVLIATGASLLIHRQFNKPLVMRNLLLGMMPGLIMTVCWLIYAGYSHLSLILLRTHGTPFNIVKFIGKGILLLTYPIAGGIFFPSVLTVFILSIITSTLGYGVYIYLRNNPIQKCSLLCHLCLPIPLYLITNVTSGYSMVGPGLIFLSCAIKGIIRLHNPLRLYLMSIMLIALLMGMIINIDGTNVFSAIYQSNKSRGAVRAMVSHLINKNALNKQTLIIAGDESSRVLIESIPNIRRRYIDNLSHTSAPNLVAIQKMHYKQDIITPNVNRIVIILASGTHDHMEQARNMRPWLQTAHFSHLTFKKEVGLYSPLMQRITQTTAPAQYTIEEWVK